MRLQFQNEKYITVNPGIVLAGTQVNNTNNTSTVYGKTNVIAKVAIAKGDLRFLNPQQQIDAKQKMLTIIKNNLTGTSASIQFQNAIPAMSPTRANLALLKQYSEISQLLNLGSVKALGSEQRGAGDISHIASLMQANLAGLGLVGTGAHSDNETLDINSVIPQTSRAALLVYQLSHAAN
jgi:glutamate carboxypeptidase